MALQRLSSGSGDRRPPIVLKVVGTREMPRVTKWAISEDDATAVTSNNNVLVAASDGESTTSFVVFEEAAHKVKVSFLIL